MTGADIVSAGVLCARYVSPQATLPSFGRAEAQSRPCYADTYSASIGRIALAVKRRLLAHRLAAAFTQLGPVAYLIRPVPPDALPVFATELLLALLWTLHMLKRLGGRLRARHAN